MLGARLRILALPCLLFLHIGLIEPAIVEDAWPHKPQSTFYSAQASNDSDKDVYEPSGAAPQSLFLYVVSDNGKVGRQLLAQDQKDFDSHQVYTDKQGDFEAVAVVPGLDSLYLGVEGDGSTVPKPKVVEYLPPASGRLTSGNAHSSLTGCEWSLDLPLTQPSDPKKKPNGMEALTFVPDGHHPFAESSGGFGGYFFASSQATAGEIRVYDLQKTESNRCASADHRP